MDDDIEVMEPMERKKRGREDDSGAGGGCIRNISEQEFHEMTNEITMRETINQREIAKIIGITEGDLPKITTTRDKLLTLIEKYKDTINSSRSFNDLTKNFNYSISDISRQNFTITIEERGFVVASLIKMTEQKYKDTNGFGSFEANHLKLLLEVFTKATQKSLNIVIKKTKNVDLVPSITLLCGVASLAPFIPKSYLRILVGNFSENSMVGTLCNFVLENQEHLITIQQSTMCVAGLAILMGPQRFIEVAGIVLQNYNSSFGRFVNVCADTSIEIFNALTMYGPILGNSFISVLKQSAMAMLGKTTDDSSSHDSSSSLNSLSSKLTKLSVLTITSANTILESVAIIVESNPMLSRESSVASTLTNSSQSSVGVIVGGKRRKKTKRTKRSKQRSKRRRRTSKR